MLALATWLLYVADRLLDGIQPANNSALHHRHHFHLRHRKPLLILAVPAVATLVWFVTTRMDPAPRREDFLLASASLLYLLCVHLPILQRSRKHLSLPKELFVGIIFAAACVIPSWSRQHASRPSLFVIALLFAALCWLNCVAIEQWGQSASQQPYRTHWLQRPIAQASLALASIASATALFFAAGHQAYAACSLCIAASAAMLAILDRCRNSLPALRLRSLADAVLLDMAAGQLRVWQHSSHASRHHSPVMQMQKF